ncbi:MAG: hypothetical protein BWX93_01257 [Bacteroidetes bacterium ADurb.Bin139]|nr:MAG: hypothetical protein BWX93_01257 [Bacteroidetes bacterium ADurb.Bin139]
MTAIAPSPVTLHAVPKLSMAIYREIISPMASGLKPRTDCSTPIAAMMAPPGTPGAATMVMASRKINPTKTAGSACMFIMTITARAQAVILSMLPDR